MREKKITQVLYQIASNWKFLKVFILLLLLLMGVGLSKKNSEEKYTDWQITGGTKENIHFSSLTQIDTSNVSQLKIRWTYHTNDADSNNHSQIQCNPIIVGDVLYATTAKLKVIALDKANGKEKWVFNPFANTSKDNISHLLSLNNNRGVTYWESGKDKRIFCTAGSFLFALNAKTGALIQSFGRKGWVDLREGLGRDVSTTFVVSTSAGIIFKDLLVIGTRVSENFGAAPGHIRAYDVRTGLQKWIFHTIPQPGEFGFESWQDTTAYHSVGGANAWAGFSLDENTGILYAPTGSATFDFYGGEREGANLFANCILALDASTGKYKWHYQTVHHDVWDRDLPSAPALVTIIKEGKKIEALAQITKTGFVFLLDRRNGEPLFPIEEKNVPTSSILFKEKLWPTQPIPKLPKPFVKQTFSLFDINNLLADSSIQDLKNRFLSYNSGHLFTPPSKEGTIFLPGLDGGANWGGAAFDPQSGVLYVNANEVPWIITIKDVISQKENETLLDAGQRLYSQYCASCHQVNRKGNGINPSLLDIEKSYNSTSFLDLLETGRRMMPSFKSLAEEERKAIASYVLNLEGKNSDFINQKKDPSTSSFRYRNDQEKFLSKEGYPANQPPWGSLNAINLSTGEIEWKIPLGEYPELKSMGIVTGTENYGGPVVTSGGLLFIAATKDAKFRAFNKRTGKLLWETELPAPGFATPSIYRVNGNQYIVIACGGGKLGTRSGDSYIAFSLP